MEELEKAFRRWRKEFPEETQNNDINAFAAGWEAAREHYRQTAVPYELRAAIATIVRNPQSKESE